MTIYYLDLIIEWLKENHLEIYQIPAGIIVWKRVTTTDKLGQTIDIDLLNTNIIGRITVWDTGECDMEALSLEGNNSLWRHFDFTSPEEARIALREYFRDVTILPNQSNKETEIAYSSPRIAIINNEKDISSLIQCYFRDNKFTTTVINPEIENDYILLLRLFIPDVIVLKVSPLGATSDVYSVCQQIRKDLILMAKPIIVISTNEQKTREAGTTSWFDIVFDLDDLQREARKLIV